MTITDNTTSSGLINADGVNTRFDFPFRIVDSTNIDVIFVDADGNETIVEPSLYRVYDIGKENGYVVMDTAPSALVDVKINLSPVLQQTTSLGLQGAYSPESVERALDNIVLMIRAVGQATYSGVEESDGIGGANGLPVGGSTGQALVKSSNANYAVEWETISGGGGGGGVTDHGALTGRGDDDHTQYHNDARGDVRYYTKSAVDTFLSDKATSSHTHNASDITDLSEAIDDQVASLIVAGSGIIKTYNDAAGTLTIAATGGGGGSGADWGDITGTLADQTDLQAALDAKVSTSALSELVDDRVDALITDSGTVVSAYDDGAGTLTLSVPDSGIVRAKIADGAINSSKIEAAAVSFSKLPAIATQTLLGRYSGSTGTVQTITLDSSLNLSGAGVLSATGTDSGTWDMPSLKADHGATGDGTTDDTAALVLANADGRSTYVPDGIYDTTLTPAQITAPLWGNGQVRDSSNNLRGKIYNYISSAPSSEGNEDSVNTAFNGDLSHVPIAIEHRIMGAATAGQPTSGYRYVPELTADYTYLYNESGHNESISGNGGRTGLAAKQVNMMQRGQGDLVAYNFSGFVNATKAGSTSYLANPAVVGINGSLSSGVDGAYFNPLEFDLQDNGFDCAAYGTVVNMSRTNGTGAKDAVWIGHAVQSLGAANIDSGFTVRGNAKIGLDFTGATFEASQRAICLKSTQKIFLNASSSNGAYANNSGNEFINWDGSKINIAVGNQSIIQVQNSNIVLAPSNVARMKVTSDVQTVGDFSVRASIDGTRYFRVTSSAVVCSSRLDIIGGLNISSSYKFGTSGGASGEFWQITFTDGTTRKIALNFNA